MKLKGRGSIREVEVELVPPDKIVRRAAIARDGGFAG